MSGGLLYQPAALAVPMTVAAMLGAVRSMLMPVTVAVELFPARSVAVPLADWLVPSPLRVCCSGQVLMPERASAQVNVTVTVWLAHPCPFKGAAIALIVGLVESMLTVTVLV